MKSISKSGYNFHMANVAGLTYTGYVIGYIKANGTSKGCANLNEYAKMIKSGMKP